MCSNSMVQLDWSPNPKIQVLLRRVVHIRPLGSEVFQSYFNRFWNLIIQKKEVDVNELLIMVKVLREDFLGVKIQ